MSTYARKWKIALVLCLVVTMLAACTGGNKSELPELPKDGTGKIRVMYFDEQSFMMEYGNTFNVKFPEIEFEVISTQELYQNVGPNDDYEKKFMEFVKEKKPDVLWLSDSQYEQLAGEGALYKLDTLIQDEKYPMDDFHPGIIELLRAKGGNALYGLANHFYSSALFYNVDLFKEYGIDPPRHKMSVNEVLELAARFESKSKDDKDRIYGLYNEFSSPGQTLLGLAEMSGLQVVDPKAEKLVMDSEGWKSLFSNYSELVKDKKTNVVDRNNNMSFGQGFAQGNAAMTIDGVWMIDRIKNADRYSSDGKKPKTFEWNMVTVPVDPAKPDETTSFHVNGIFAIANDSANKRPAWEFLKFTSGPEMAKINGKSSSKLTTRTQYQKEIGGKSTEAFTMLKPSATSRPLYVTLQKNKVHNEFAMQLETKLNEAVQAVVDGKKSPEQAYTEILPGLQEQLNIAKKKGTEKKETEKK